VVYKTDRQYHDFDVNEDWETDCEYPRFWTDTGEMVGRNVTDMLNGCKKSDFDQYGDVASLGEYPEWQKQISKFAFVQDRLREWRPSVLDKIKHFSCLTIQALDIDGFRIDKALTITSDAQAEWSAYVRQCAKDVGKTNFFLPGEIVGANTLAAIYVGRGKEPQMAVKSVEDAFQSKSGQDELLYIRDEDKGALDAGAFHYSIYRSMTRFLGIDGIYAALLDTPVNWAEGWKTILMTNDLVNQNTGEFDPRHMYGVTNQDVFRWPAITNGVERNLLGLFVTTMILPGIPVLMWGEEQASYVLENTVNNYLFGRSPMTSTLAWQLHGCYKIGSDKYNNFPLDRALRGCEDEGLSLDHRDPSHPVRNILKRMYELRSIYPAIQDGFMLEQLSNKTYNIYLPGSGGAPTETGIWSVARSAADTQTLSGGQGNQSVWLIYGNENKTVDYTFDCNNVNNSLLAPFGPGTTVKNLFYPYEEYTLGASVANLGMGGLSGTNGCLSQLTLPAWGYKALVPKASWVDAKPAVVAFSPGHDYRYQSKVAAGQQETIPFGFSFTKEMDCQSVTNSISIESNTEDNSTPKIDPATVQCNSVALEDPAYVGGLVQAWSWTANLINVSNGVHAIVTKNATTASKNSYTDSVDRFLLRVGQLDNPMVFPHNANYSSSLLHKNSDGSLYVTHKAPGATKFRYSVDWNTHYSDWMDYTGGSTNLAAKNWTGTSMQSWEGDHVYVQYWGKLAASSAHYQHGDVQSGNKPPRRFPHLFVQGPFNQYSYDTGIPGQMTQDSQGIWKYDFMTEWPTQFQINEWGLNPDGQPDQTLILGDVDGDFVLDRLPPGSLLTNVVNITGPPPSPYTGWTIAVNDGTLAYSLIPVGNRWIQLIVFVLLALIPILTAAATIYIFMKSFYKIKFNQLGVGSKSALIPLAVRRKFRKGYHEKRVPSFISTTEVATSSRSNTSKTSSDSESPNAMYADAGGSRRSVLIATMEYDIEDWAIKIKIGGLGVMAQLMGKNLGHLDLIWVVPCVGGVDYPIDQPAESMFITIFDKEYEIQVQYHVLRNITYVLLDAPVFRKQSKTEPYPARMDDLESAIYYSAWNQCIAQTIQRFEPSIYHINDYHGALAPVYLLPKVTPVALSLHNAEFQGLWPMRTVQEREEVCKVFNIDPENAKKYVQFGEVFNLLHAGASFLRLHQKGFGAVGVSKKYGKRTFARYPIFWGLSKIGSLPNPDPTDTGAWDRDGSLDSKDVMVDANFEANRPALKRQAQEWAGLDQRPDAELFVFVGRWSMQKGIDLIADVFPSILDNYPKAQLICVGPVIDLYGRFAALKLEKMMQLYPGRVYSKPEFTALPPYIFSGSEFALIPSRDEPFGLVAVEFGRKGALGVGAKVGGLGQMPGWWYSIESMTPKHLVQQFKTAIHDALASSPKTRAKMRARSALQRFPVAQWVEDLDTLQSSAIKISKTENTPEKIEKQLAKVPSSANLRTLFNGGHSGRDSPSMPMRSFSSNLAVPGSPGTPSGPWTPGSGYNSSGSVSPFSPYSAGVDDILLPPTISPGNPRGSMNNRRFSTLSFDSIAASRKEFALQKVDPSFTDASGVYARQFKEKLEQTNLKASDNLCIEEVLIKSEKDFFNSYRDAKMGYAAVPTSSRAGSIRGGSVRNGSLFGGSRASSPRPETPVGSFFHHSHTGSFGSNGSQELLNGDFGLGAEYVPPTGLKRILLYRLYDWPVYSIILAFGQIIAANSYQVTLLIGEVGQTAMQLYIIATIYAVSSIMWWGLFRRMQSVYVLSLPFAFYGLAFFFIGMAPFAGSYFSRGWIQNTATGLYAVASSSGAFFFALNFGDEGGAPIKSWVLRACIVQGTQQLYISALWYWGAALVTLSYSGQAVSGNYISGAAMTAITIPIACFLWAVGAVLFVGLPKFYRQAPGKVPSFYTSIFRRKIILVSGCPTSNLEHGTNRTNSGSSWPSSSRTTSSRRLTDGTGATFGRPNMLRLGPSSSSSSSSSSESGLSSSYSSPDSPLLTLGSCLFSRLVLVLLVGARCFGVPPLLAPTSHGPEVPSVPPYLAAFCGCGLVCSMLFRVSGLV
jgi:alpha-1,3-glucan synthase